MPLITCEISESGSVIKTITKETSTEPRELLATLETFRLNVNEVFTNMIDDVGEIEDAIGDDDESSTDESAPVPVSPKKRKK